MFLIKMFSLTTESLKSNQDKLNVVASLLILGSMATSLSFKTEVFNIGLILLAIGLSVWRPGFNIFKADNVVRIWTLALLVSAVIWIISIYTTFDSEISDYEKPLKYVACALVALQLSKLNIPIKVVFIGAILSVTLSTIYALNHNYVRLELQMNAGTAAYQLTILFGIIASYLFFNHEKSSYLLIGIGWIGLGACLWLIFETQTRGAWVVLICYLIIVSVLELWTLNTRQRLYSGVMIVFLFFAAIAVMSQLTIIEKRFNATMVDIENVQNRDLSGSIGRRVALLQIGYSALKKPSLFGSGENSLANLKGYINELENGDQYKFLLSNLHFHNQYLDHFTKRGVLGFVAYMLFLFGPLFLTRREALPYVSAVAFPLIVGGFIETPFNNSNFITSYILYMTFVIVAQNNRLNISSNLRRGTQ